MKTYFSLADFDFRNKRVLVRTGYDVPLEDGKVKDTTRIVANMPTIDYLIKKNAKVILISHLGRPGGKADPKFSLRPVFEELKRLMKMSEGIYFLTDCVGKDIKPFIDKIKPGEIVLLENLRFHKEEEENGDKFAAALASCADYYIDDAFGAAHRAHASIDAITNYLPSGIGLLMERETVELAKILRPKKPFICILGGLKVADKIKTIKHLAENADKMLIGGALGNTFLKAKGINIGKSRIDAVEIAEDILKRYHQKIILPEDVMVSVSETKALRIAPIEDIKENEMIMDIGPKTQERFKKELENAETIFWNGPLGVCELPEFARGTETIAEFLSKLHSTRIIGGGDSVDAVAHFKLEKNFTYISTGGGAALEFLEGNKLPAIAALERSYERFKNQK